MLHEPINMRMGIATLLIVGGTLMTQKEVREWVRRKISA
jgi:hypothetical protein